MEKPILLEKPWETPTEELDALLLKLRTYQEYLDLEEISNNDQLIDTLNKKIVDWLNTPGNFQQYLVETGCLIDDMPDIMHLSSNIVRSTLSWIDQRNMNTNPNDLDKNAIGEAVVTAAKNCGYDIYQIKPSNYYGAYYMSHSLEEGLDTPLFLTRHMDLRPLQVEKFAQHVGGGISARQNQFKNS